MLADLQSLKDFLNISGTEADAFLTKCLQYASGAIKSYLRREIEAADYDEYYDGTGTSDLFVREWPVVSVSLLEVGGVEVPDDGYVVYAESGRIHLTNGHFPSGHRNVHIQYRAGYESIPEEIELACIELAGLIWRDSTQGKGHLGQSDISVREGGTIRLVRRLPPYLQEALKSYRRLAIA